MARLIAHALLKRLGIDTSQWSVARGLACENGNYRRLLMAADGPRRGDRDGRGNLTQAGLLSFCRFFLDRAINQVRFMDKLLDPEDLLRRMKLHVEEEICVQRLPAGSYVVLREAALAGQVEREHLRALTGDGEEATRVAMSALIERGMLNAASDHAPLRLAFPAEVAYRWLPGLYPEEYETAP